MPCRSCWRSRRSSGGGTARAERGHARSRGLPEAFFAADLILWHHSIAAVGAGLGTVLGNVQVVLVPIAAWLLLSERPGARVVAAVPVVLIGVVLISGAFGDDAYGSDPALGVLFGVAHRRRVRGLPARAPAIARTCTLGADARDGDAASCGGAATGPESRLDAALYLSGTPIAPDTTAAAARHPGSSCSSRCPRPQPPTPMVLKNPLPSLGNLT